MIIDLIKYLIIQTSNPITNWLKEISNWSPQVHSIQNNILMYIIKRDQYISHLKYTPDAPMEQTVTYGPNMPRKEKEQDRSYREGVYL